MNQEKFGKLIKEIRKKNNLTQKDLADKYNVTYQAVSKWENGKNMPDTMLIKKIANDFNISIDDIFDGKLNKKKKYNNLIIIFGFIIILFLIVLLFLFNDKGYEFKKVSSECENFNISGSIAYNKNKSSIFINNLEYCGNDASETYKNIECTLYEMNDNVIKKISTCNYSGKIETTLDNYLKTVTLSSDDYERTCKTYNENSLYLEINATNKDNKIVTYKVPLKMQENCND